MRYFQFTNMAEAKAFAVAAMSLHLNAIVYTDYVVFISN